MKRVRKRGVALKIRQECLREYDGRCGECGIELNSARYEVHHIDGNCWNDCNTNLIPLCRGCHLRTESKIDWFASGIDYTTVPGYSDRTQRKTTKLLQDGLMRLAKEGNDQNNYELFKRLDPEVLARRWQSFRSSRKKNTGVSAIQSKSPMHDLHVLFESCNVEKSVRVQVMKLLMEYVV